VAEHGASDEKLCHMANQIAAFFHAYPADEARTGIAQHIADFWTPAMRRTLQDTVDRGGDGLDHLVMQALGGTDGASSMCRGRGDALLSQRATRATIDGVKARTKT